MAPAVGVPTVIVAVAVAPLAMEPRVKVITFKLRALVPWVEVAERKVTVGGRVLVRETPLAVEGPALVTNMV